ncbi:MAG: hypothetical protein BGO39_01520 [Chloroflexi bacterium 54-19]|nr:MAG: hypothetical protein BGO39_01520 [Chloroflexi bacterium 54-19]
MTSQVGAVDNKGYDKTYQCGNGSRCQSQPESSHQRCETVGADSKSFSVIIKGPVVGGETQVIGM